MDALQKRSTGEIKTIPIQRIREMRILGEPQFPLADYAWAKESDPSGQESDEEPYERWTIVDDEPMSPIALEDRPRCAVCGSQEHEGSSCPQRHPSGGIAGPSSSSSGADSQEKQIQEILSQERRAREECWPESTEEETLSGEEPERDPKRLRLHDAHCAPFHDQIHDTRMRIVLEFCCSNDSLMGAEQYNTPECRVIRLTEQVDMTSEAGLQFALNHIDKMKYVFLWTSLPCTAGSPWQRVNAIRNPNHEAHIEEMLEQHHLLFQNWLIVARAVQAARGDIGFEWPRDCALWDYNHVQEALAEFGMCKVNFHGCALGLTARNGLPIKKPWSVSTTSPQVFEALERYQCPGPAHHPEHAPCAGQDTKLTEN